jgi:hypothetical protein
MLKGKVSRRKLMGMPLFRILVTNLVKTRGRAQLRRKIAKLHLELKRSFGLLYDRLLLLDGDKVRHISLVSISED